MRQDPPPEKKKCGCAKKVNLIPKTYTHEFQPGGEIAPRCLSPQGSRSAVDACWLAGRPAGRPAGRLIDLTGIVYVRVSVPPAFCSCPLYAHVCWRPCVLCVTECVVPAQGAASAPDGFRACEPVDLVAAVVPLRDDGPRRQHVVRRRVCPVGIAPMNSYCEVLRLRKSLWTKRRAGGCVFSFCFVPRRSKSCQICHCCGLLFGGKPSDFPWPATIPPFRLVRSCSGCAFLPFGFVIFVVCVVFVSYG